MSSETEDSDRALKPGPPSNLLHSRGGGDRAGEEVGELRGKAVKDRETKMVG